MISTNVKIFFYEENPTNFIFCDDDDNSRGG